ncbi:MAG: hypothetical protein AVDCRST_MAG57-2914, partial [uncultured Blastococcus sp.]
EPRRAAPSGVPEPRAPRPEPGGGVGRRARAGPRVPPPPGCGVCRGRRSCHGRHGRRGSDGGRPAGRRLSDDRPRRPVRGGSRRAHRDAGRPAGA